MKKTIWCWISLGVFLTLSCFARVRSGNSGGIRFTPNTSRSTMRQPSERRPLSVPGSANRTTTRPGGTSIQPSRQPVQAPSAPRPVSVPSRPAMQPSRTRAVPATAPRTVPATTPAPRTVPAPSTVRSPTPQKVEKRSPVKQQPAPPVATAPTPAPVARPPRTTGGKTGGGGFSRQAPRGWELDQNGLMPRSAPPRRPDYRIRSVPPPPPHRHGGSHKHRHPHPRGGIYFDPWTFSWRSSAFTSTWAGDPFGYAFVPHTRWPVFNPYWGWNGQGGWGWDQTYYAQTIQEPQVVYRYVVSDDGQIVQTPVEQQTEQTESVQMVYDDLYEVPYPGREFFRIHVISTLDTLDRERIWASYNGLDQLEENPYQLYEEEESDYE
ncbi:MAG: hypothetical protein IJR99_00975 [Kiritimatiellae bacterium]|nr:hypothetical protein [Kiritimatiellia bacterium]